MKFQPDVLSEQSLIIQFIKYEKQREKILQFLTPFNFLIPEHKNLVYSLFQIAKDKVELKDDIILAYSLQCKQGKPVTFEYLDELKKSYGQEEFDVTPLIKKIKKDSYVSGLLENDLPTLIEGLLTPASTLSTIENFLEKQKGKISQIQIQTDSDFKTLKQLTEEHNVIDKQRVEGKNFYPTGFSNLDENLTYGFLPKGITIVAGRPGMAKSAFVTNLGKNLSNKKIHCLMFTLESDNLTFYDRLLSQYSQVPIANFVKERRTLAPDELKSIEHEKRRLIKNPYLLLNDNPASLPYIKNQIQIEQEKQRREYFVVVIDLFMKVKEMLESEYTAQNYEKNLNFVQQMSKELGIHTILVAQINRAVEKRKNRRPMMSDLKSSGSWEEVADLILGLHREAYYLEKYENEVLDEDILEAQVLKQRQGQDGQVVKYIFDRYTTSLRRYDEHIDFNKEFEAFV